MVNGPFMVGPQSLLSRTNSSRPAKRDEEGGGAPGRVFFGVRSPRILFLPYSSLARLCKVALVRADRVLLRTGTAGAAATCRNPTIQDSLDHLEEKSLLHI